MNEDVLTIMERFAALDIGTLVLQDGAFSLSLTKTAQPLSISAADPQSSQFVESQPGAATASAAQASGSFYEVRSPLVGVFYAGSSPDAPPFVQVGDVVAEGTVLCLVEAMKQFNELPSPCAGVVRKVCVSDGALIGFDDVLFEIEVSDD